MRVYVYFNLHKKVWSVRALEGARKGRVIAHRTDLELADCTFKVSEPGRQRVMRERRKNVHAGIVGTLLTSPAPEPLTRRITYDPYRFSTFVDADTLEPQFGAKRVLFTATGVQASTP